MLNKEQEQSLRAVRVALLDLTPTPLELKLYEGIVQTLFKKEMAAFLLAGKMFSCPQVCHIIYVCIFLMTCYVANLLTI